ncbi:MAG: hypothetical protein ACRC2T_13420, partial [Thermoguttaceae bacterium]
QQFDVFNWIFDIVPDELRAIGGVDYYDYGDCCDNLTALLTYNFPKGKVRGVSRVWTTTSCAGSLPFEHIYGDNGSVQLSQSEEYFKLYAEPGRATWSEFVRSGYLKKANTVAEGEDPNLVKVRETGNIVPYKLTVDRPSSLLKLHLENFVQAIITAGKTDTVKLNCPADSVLASHDTAWKIDKIVP